MYHFVNRGEHWLLVNITSLFLHRSVVCGPLAQSAERGADNAKVVTSSLTRTKYFSIFLFQLIFVPVVQ